MDVAIIVRGEELRAADGIIHCCLCYNKNIHTVAVFSYFGFLPFNAVGIHYCYSDVIRYFSQGDGWCAKGRVEQDELTWLQGSEISGSVTAGLLWPRRWRAK